MSIAGNSASAVDAQKAIQYQLPPAQLETHTAFKIHLTKTSDKPIKDAKNIDNQKALAKKHNDKKLATTILSVETGLTAYHIW